MPQWDRAVKWCSLQYTPTHTCSSTFIHSMYNATVRQSCQVMFLTIHTRTHQCSSTFIHSMYNATVRQSCQVMFLTIHTHTHQCSSTFIHSMYNATVRQSCLCMNVELHVCVGVYCKEHHLTALSHCVIIHAVYECRATCVCRCVL